MELVMVVSSILLWIIVLLNLFLTLALARRLNAWVSQFRDPFADNPRLELGQPAPFFTAETLSGSIVSLADYTGHTVVFIFISSTCNPCREKIPVLNALQPKANRAGVEIALVSISDYAETKKFSEEIAISLPILIAPRSTNPFMENYKANGTPFYCLVDVDGNVQATGFLDDKWEALIKTWDTSLTK